MGTTGQSITLANSIIGVGILAMPFCFQQCGVLLATLILMSMGLMSRLCCYFLLKSAIITRRRNFEFLAFHVFGPAGKMAVETGIIGFLMGTCIAYFVVVGDLGPQIIAKMFNINQSDILRTSIMVIVSLVCILPLGLLRNVDSLSNVSAATIAFYFCLVIKVIAEATSQLFTTDWYNRMEMWKPSGVLQCVPIFSMALFCQTQLFEIFESMPSVSLEKMCLVTKNAINICAVVYMTLGLFGYIAFSSQEISGNILMSLSPTWASDVIKLGFVMSLAFSFPLIIFPCRASLYSFLYRKAHPSQHDHTNQIPVTTFRLITVGIVGAALVVSLMLPNVELVLGLLGATVGVLVCVVFPAACFLNVTYKDTNERLLAKFIVVLGLFILVLGTFANLQAAENTRDKYDDRHITKERIDKIVEDFFNHQQESEAALRKPNLQTNKIAETEIIKDSEVQPPNPVPPEAQPIDNDPGLKPLEEKDDKPKEILPNTKEEILNRETESHPRNLKLKSNGQNVDENNKTPNEGKEANEGLENSIDIKQEKISNSQEKIDMLKQQQLVETIKQHGEEQKELLNEQKNILKEILKTKQELESKKEEEKNEAKKIAVESIQKIANMAIQSIGGVTEKPLDKIPDPIQNIADAAVNEIAKNAAETLKVIKQLDKPSISIKTPDIISNGEKKLTKQSKADNNIADVNKPALSKQNGINQGISNSAPLMIQEPNNIVRDKVNKALNDIKLQKEQEINNADSNISNINSKLQETKLNPSDSVNDVVKIKENLTLLPEKPKSKERIEINQKAPIPLILNPQDNLKMDVPKNNLADSAKSENDNKINMRDDTDKIIDRQKREVVDCTETTLLQPEDKQICENLVNKPITNSMSDILPKVDLNDALSNKIPLDILSVHHIRSLKSFDEDKKR